MFPRCGPIPTYAVFYAAGLFVHLQLCVHLARRLGVKPRLAWLITGCYAFGMTVGAKILFDLQQGIFRPASLVSLRHYLEGGMWGGPLIYLALGVPLAFLSTHRRAALDLVAITMPLPMILAKLGCLAQGCCYGSACAWAWGMRYPEGGAAPANVPLHPTQVYEILVLALAGVVLLMMLKWTSWRGLLLPAFIAMYGAGRSLTEIWRHDRERDFPIGPLTGSQAVLLVAALAAVVVLVAFRPRRPEPLQSVTTADDSVSIHSST